MYKISFSKKAKEDLKKLDKEIQKRITSVLERIIFNPKNYTEKIIGKPGFKLKVDKHRIILEISESQKVILIEKIGHRKNIYKN